MTPSQTLRTFLAIDLDANIQTELKKIQRNLQQSNADVKWVEPHHIHITLKFFADLPIEKIDPLKQALQDTLQNHPTFPITFTHLGAFPTIKNPKIIWAGMHLGKEESTRLFTLIEEKLQKMEFPKEEREFFPHATIGRTKSSHLKDLSSLITRHGSFSEIQQQVSKVTLYKSTLRSMGPLYESIETFHLNKD